MHREISHKNQPFAGESNLSLYLLTALLGLLIGADLWPVIASWLAGQSWALPTWPREFYPGYRLALIAAVLGGARVLYGSIESLLEGKLGADMALAIACLAAILTRKPLVAAEVVFIGMVGESLEALTFDRTKWAIRSLVEIFPRRCWLVRDGQEVRVFAHDLQVGDRVIVKPGARVPVDGVVVDGHSAVDTSALTGESVPVEKSPGDQVLAGSLNQFGALQIEAERVADQTVAGRVIELTSRALADKANLERTADRLARLFLPVVLGLALLTLIGYTIIGASGCTGVQRTWSDALAWSIDPTLAVLVVACPCALILATPATVIAALGRLAGTGVLIKSGAAIERLAEVDIIAFDKTGTLTEARLELGDVYGTSDVSPDTVLAVAAAAEERADHPLARLIVEAAQAKHLPLEPVLESEARPGAGVQARTNSGVLRVGTLRWLRETGITIDDELMSSAERLERAGQTPMFVARDQVALGVIGARDRARPEAAGIVADLRSLGIKRIALLTGDRPAVAQAIASEVGIDEFEAELLPDQKAAWIVSRQRDRGLVAMLGDGINDAPALAVANVGLAIGGTGVDLAAEAGDVVLMGDPLRILPFLIRLSRHSVRIIRQNIIGFAFGVNILGIVATAWIWPLLSTDPTWHEQAPLAGVIYHQIGSLAVLLNAMRLLWFERGPGKTLGRWWIWLQRFDAWLEHHLDPHELSHWLIDHRSKLAAAGSVMIVFLYFACGFTIIKTDEVGLVQRFGRLRKPELAPGWHWILPWPVDQVSRVQPDLIRTIEMGYRGQPGGLADNLAWGNIHGIQGERKAEEAVMITGDGNLVEIQATIAYSVDRQGLANYLFSVEDVEGMLRAAAESALRQTAASRPFIDLLTRERGQFQKDALARLQERCRVYGEHGLGVRVQSVTLHDLHPPREVVPAYHEVAKAMQGRDRQVNEAQAESIRQGREALSKHEQLIHEAEADAHARIQTAKASAAVFSSHLNVRNDVAPGSPNGSAQDDRQRQDHAAMIRALTDFRLFWDNLGLALAGRDKIIIDADQVPGRRHLFLLDPETWRVPALAAPKPAAVSSPRLPDSEDDTDQP